MKLFKVCFIVLFVFSQSLGFSLPAAEGVPAKRISSIVMDDDVMMVDVNDAFAMVEYVEVSHQNTFSTAVFEGCSSSTCYFDLSHLISGDYAVTVWLSDGSVFCGTIEIH